MLLCCVGMWRSKDHITYRYMKYLFWNMDKQKDKSKIPVTDKLLRSHTGKIESNRIETEAIGEEFESIKLEIRKHHDMGMFKG
jgi:hypothetical protein